MLVAMLALSDDGGALQLIFRSEQPLAGRREAFCSGLQGVLTPGMNGEPDMSILPARVVCCGVSQVFSPLRHTLKEGLEGFGHESGDVRAQLRDRSIADADVQGRLRLVGSF